jgi:hypothetical protein
MGTQPEEPVQLLQFAPSIIADFLEDEKLLFHVLPVVASVFHSVPDIALPNFHKSYN